jgi:HTH-type transcriptional regulator/antitoxin HipB
VKYSPKNIGETIKSTRKSMGVTQNDLALTSGTGLRFIIDLEKGKPTCQIGKVLAVLQTLGITITLVLPPSACGAGANQKAKGA